MTRYKDLSPEERKQYHREYNHRRYHTDPVFRTRAIEASQRYIRKNKQVVLERLYAYKAKHKAKISEYNALYAIEHKAQIAAANQLKKHIIGMLGDANDIN